MPTTAQMLAHADYSEPVIEAIAELRGVMLVADDPDAFTDLLAAEITEPESIQSIIEELSDEDPHSREALDFLLQHGGQTPATRFMRAYGEIRRMGAAKLQRDQPWLSPEGAAEKLFYLGLIGAGFSDVDNTQTSQSIIYIPSDVIPWLPVPEKQPEAQDFKIQPTELPPQSHQALASDDFLEDAGTLLEFLYDDALRIVDGAANPEDLSRFTQRLMHAYTDQVVDSTAHNADFPTQNTGQPTKHDDEKHDRVTAEKPIPTPDQVVRTDLLLHLANRLGWLTVGETNHVHLANNRVTAFLDATRAEQRRMLWDAWRLSPKWNDLCQTPELRCMNPKAWSNNPVQTREAVLRMLSRLEAGEWYSQRALLDAVRESEPDFQRPTGEYDSWYVHDATTQEFLAGFERWDEVEGALLRFLLRGPLKWLQAIDLSYSESGEVDRFSLSAWGAYWLSEGAPQPEEPYRQPITVGADFRVTVRPGTALLVRFNVQRFASWQSSGKEYVYQINRRSLAKADENGISAQRVADYLSTHASSVPANVDEALRKYVPAAKD